VDTFENCPITLRLPFNRTGEVILKAGAKNVTFPAEAFTFNHDKPFELAFVTFKLTALAENAVCDPQPNVLDRLITVRMQDSYRLHPVGNLTLMSIGDGVFRWTPLKPMQLHRGTVLQLSVDGRDMFDVAFDGARKRIHEIRVEATMEGEQLVLGPRPSNVGVEAPLG
jgi:hypothetical protein